MLGTVLTITSVLSLLQEILFSIIHSLMYATKLVTSLTCMINRCINDCIFPDSLKMANVSPVFKTKDEFTNKN